ncbi:MAG: ABC transporter ATP-binding protein [Thermodesulfobacteriota bacterium]
MATPIIEIDGISKSYLIGKKVSYGSLREEIALALSAPFRRMGKRRSAGDGAETVWALKDVSFDVKEGEVVGIIGKNGAGKSTLLKILSRITDPTGGRISMRGRIASLLEVGTGFHPELTGRENIFLNGALLGMNNVEIRKKFDEIVAFSEIEKFLDTPVKRYSSGMYVRLAFAVAAHLEPEILIVDEVLAVGDSAFQQKCLGKMGEVAEGGRTILFVSHNMAAMKKLCSRGVLLEGGRVAATGTVEDVTERYLNSGNVEEGGGPVRITGLPYHHKRTGFNIEDIKVTGLKGGEIRHLGTGDIIKIRVDYNANKTITSPGLVIKFKTNMGVEVFRLSNMPISGYSVKEIKGRGYFELTIKYFPLLGGLYMVDIELARENIELYFTLEKAIQLRVEPTDVYGSGLAMDTSRGLIAVAHEWKQGKLSGIRN